MFSGQQIGRTISGASIVQYHSIHIRELCESTSQKEVAALLGVTQGAIHLMLRDKREIYGLRDDYGVWIDFIEYKSVMKRNK